jgi:hypothetical protein
MRRCSKQAAAVWLELASRVLWDGIIIALGVQFAGARERSGLDLPEIGAEQSWVGDNLPFVSLQKAGTGLAGDELRIGGSSASEEAGARGVSRGQ